MEAKVTSFEHNCTYLPITVSSTHCASFIFCLPATLALFQLHRLVILLAVIEPLHISSLVSLLETVPTRISVLSLSASSSEISPCDPKINQLSW